MDMNQQLAHVQAHVQAQINQLQRIQQILANPAQQIVQQPAQQSSAASEATPAGQQEMLIRLYDEFVNTDEGKQLAANLARFARFAQSKVDKKEV